MGRLPSAEYENQWSSYESGKISCWDLLDFCSRLYEILYNKDADLFEDIFERKMKIYEENDF